MSAPSGRPTTAADLRRNLDAYRAEPGEFRLVDVPEQRYLMIDGAGDPDSPAFASAMEALYAVAYTLKFAARRDAGREYVVMPVEGLWWADDPAAFAAGAERSGWRWTLMTLVPDWVDEQRVADAASRTGAARRPERIGDVRLGTLQEGRSVQTLHIGRFEDEAAVLETMHRAFLPEHGLRPAGKHHEIYLSDPRRVAPDRLRTVLRQPVAERS